MNRLGDPLTQKGYKFLWVRKPMRWGGGRRLGASWWVNYGPVSILYFWGPDFSDPLGQYSCVALRFLWLGFTWTWENAR